MPWAGWTEELAEPDEQGVEQGQYVDLVDNPNSNPNANPNPNPNPYPNPNQAGALVESMPGGPARPGAPGSKGGWLRLRAALAEIDAPLLCR